MPVWDAGEFTLQAILETTSIFGFEMMTLGERLWGGMPPTNPQGRGVVRLRKCCSFKMTFNGIHCCERRHCHFDLINRHGRRGFVSKGSNDL